MKKWGFFIVAILTMFFVGIGCSKIVELEEADLSGRNIDIGKPIEVLFNLSEDQDAIKTNFTISPLHGQIEVQYIDGGWEQLIVYLYDNRYEDCIQSAEIENVGDSLLFSNLSSQNLYFFEVEGQNINNCENMVLRFSE